jgi:hypothetical protein
LLEKGFLILLLLGFLFSFQVSVLADEGGGHDESVKKATEKFRSDTTETVDHEGDEEQHHEEVSEEKHSTTNQEDEIQHEDQESDHEEGVHEEGTENSAKLEVEPGPDYLVLGAFGTVNFTFLFIGFWNKWLRRKGE